MRAIQISWLGYCFPTLLLAYIGQAAFISVHPEAYLNPFFNTVPPGFLYPSLVVAVLAAIVASQAMITACFQVGIPGEANKNKLVDVDILAAHEPVDETVILPSNEDCAHVHEVSWSTLCSIPQLDPIGWHSTCHSCVF